MEGMRERGHSRDGRYERGHSRYGRYEREDIAEMEGMRDRT